MLKGCEKELWMFGEEKEEQYGFRSCRPLKAVPSGVFELYQEHMV